MISRGTREDRKVANGLRNALLRTRYLGYIHISGLRSETLYHLREGKLPAAKNGAVGASFSDLRSDYLLPCATKAKKELKHKIKIKIDFAYSTHVKNKNQRKKKISHTEEK